jgi:acyl CoA:acetate/3-ketoacid CoA transferase alpha subunit
MDKVIVTAAEAVADIPQGAAIACGGFGICGIPTVLIDALAVLDVTDEGHRLVECAAGVTEAEVRAATEPDLLCGPA